MLSTRSLIAIYALTACALAQSTTSVTSMFLYGFEGDNIVASVISAAPQSTEYFITCAPGTDSSDCGFGPGVTFTEGPSTLAIHLTESGALCVFLYFFPPYHYSHYNKVNDRADINIVARWTSTAPSPPRRPAASRQMPGQRQMIPELQRLSSVVFLTVVLL